MAWWYDGVLHNLTLLHVPPEPEAGRYLRQQLAQMAWAGEVEGWVTAPPRWHLVAGPELAVTWEPWLREEGEPVEMVAETAAAAEVAALTARRAAGRAERHGLLPADIAARYRQQFIDRIWMRRPGGGPGDGGGRHPGLPGRPAGAACSRSTAWRSISWPRASSYTNAMKIKAEVQVLQDQVDLQYAALECWKAAATLLPSELTLEGLNFQRGKTVTVFGSGPAEASQERRRLQRGARQGHLQGSDPFQQGVHAGSAQHPGQGLRWSLTAELKRNITE